MDNYTIISAAEDYLIAGVNVLPCNDNKNPIRSEWSSLQANYMAVEDIEKEFKRAKFVAAITGQISGNLELIDFDNHNHGIDPYWNKFKLENADLFAKYDFYIERTLRGGIHLLYRIDSEDEYHSRKLAYWNPKEAMIETKAEGGYCIVAPSPGYTTISGDITLIPTIRPDERDQLILCAKKYSLVQKSEQQEEAETGHHFYTDPVSWFNWNKAGVAKYVLEKEGWKKQGLDRNKVEQWVRPGKEDGISATWGHKYNSLYVFSSSADPFESECYYTPFQIMVLLTFKGNYNAALNWIISKYFNEKVPYVRVGVDYFKKISKRDRFSIDGVELKKWTKEEIKQDHGKPFLDLIPKFDDFCIVPDNFKYSPVYNNCYNLYCEFRHKSLSGQWKWTKILLEHVFGEQIDLGIRYLKVLYMHPDRMLPILVLVSKERQTGKTTFLNWLNMVFGDNMVLITPEDLINGFNSIYATANIIAVEETLIEKSITVEKIKSLATGKFISVNQKFVSQFKLPFFGKIIMTSNNEDKFARIDEEEIRFFIRKLGVPKFQNHDIERDLVNEIPAFLKYLEESEPVDFRIGRVPFTTEELQNDSLTAVKKESKSGLYKDLKELFTDLFENLGKFQEEIFATPVDIKNRWFSNNSKIDPQYIRSVLKNEYGLTPEENQRYTPLGEVSISSKSGTPFKFTWEMFNLDKTKHSDEIPF